MSETKRQILAAARHIIESKGLVSATTKAIAKEANCAEGSLYNHFHNRAELLLAVFKENLPLFSEALNGLAFKVGEETVEENFRDIFMVSLSFYRETAPLMGSLFSDRSLLEHYQKTLSTSKSGPQTSQGHLLAYLKAEQRLRRIDPSIDLTFLAEMMLGVCFQRAFREKFMEPPTQKNKDYLEDDQIFAEQLASMMAKILK